MRERIDKLLIATAIKPGEKAAKQYGVLGMKWGVRRDRRTLAKSRGEITPSTNKKNSAPSKQSNRRPNTFRAKPENRRMSDAELRQKLSRLQMEKQFKELTASPRGKSFVREVLADTGKQATRRALTGVSTRAVDVGLQLILEKAAATSKNPSTKVFLTAMAETGKKKNKKN